MIPSSAPRNIRSGAKKTFHFCDTEAETTMVRTPKIKKHPVDDEVNINELETNSSTAVFCAPSSTKKPGNSTNESISNFSKPIQPNISNNVERKKLQADDTGCTPTFLPPSRRMEISVENTSILLSPSEIEENLDDFHQTESSNFGGRSDAKNLDIKTKPKESGNMRATSKRAFNEPDTALDIHTEFDAKPICSKRPKKTCKDDQEMEKDYIFDGDQQLHLSNDEIHGLSQDLEMDFELNIPSPTPPEYLSPSNSPDHFLHDDDDNNDIAVPDISPAANQDHSPLLNQLNITCQHYANVMEKYVDTIENMIDDLPKDLIDNAKYLVVKKYQIERNRLRAEAKRLAKKIKEKQSTQMNGFLNEDQFIDTTISSRSSWENSSLPPCEDSIFKKSPPASEQDTALELLDYTSGYFNNNAPSCLQNSTKYQTESRTDMIDVSCEKEENLPPAEKIGNLPDDGNRPEFKRSDYAFSRDMFKALRQSFGLKCFRANQREAITASLLQKDCFILMPTGGGKSLCYQLPAIISPGVTVVVSPLKSLIQDQVSKLVSNHIPAFHLTGETSEKGVQDIYRDLSFSEPQTKLLYVTPEKLGASEKLLTTLRGLYNRKKLSRFIIDEAHCVSQWGHDFRPDYKKLSALKKKFPGVPMMALTATATPRVRKDIVTQLGMENPMWFSQSFDRPNLQFLVRPKKQVMKEIIELIKRSHANDTGLVYCLSRNECEKVAKDLQRTGIQAVAYHAGLSDAERAKVQEDWIRDRFKVICATIAFGMGIDKADVRFVFHFSLPKSLEGYFQECGRAGRDGQNAVCILFYSYSDVHRLKRIFTSDQTQTKESMDVHMNNLFRVVEYCENVVECRREQLLEYFGETGFDSADCRSDKMTVCDNCSSSDEMIEVNALQSAKIIVDSVNTLIHRGNSNWRRPMVQLTLNHLVDVFKGSQNAKVEKECLNRCSMYGKCEQNFTRTDAERLFRMLVMEDILAEDLIIGAHSQVISYAKLGPKAMDFLNDRVKLPRFFIRKPKSSKRSAYPKGSSSTANNVNNECCEHLVSCCKNLAEANGMKPEHIFTYSTLREMADKLPMTRDEMLDIEGVTEYKMDNYGQQFLELTITYGGALDDNMSCDFDFTLGNNDRDNEPVCTSPYWPSPANNSGAKANKELRVIKKKSLLSKKSNTTSRKSTSCTSTRNSNNSNPLVKSYQDFSKGRNFGSDRGLGFLTLPPKK